MSSIRQVFSQMADAGRFRKPLHGPFQGAENAVGSFDSFGGEVVPNFIEVLFSEGSEDKGLQGRLRLRLTLLRRI